MPNDTWQRIGDVTQRMLRKIAPAPYIVQLDADLAASLEQRASREGCKVEALIATAIQRYMREAA